MDNERAKEVWSSTWSSMNALDRNWIRKHLAEARPDCKLMFIELELTDPDLLRMHADATGDAERQMLEELREWFECSYTPLGRSASPEARPPFFLLLFFSPACLVFSLLRLKSANFVKLDKCYLIAKIGFDTAENDPFNICQQ